MMEQMTLKDLKTGMHVVLRNGDELIVMKGVGDNNDNGLVDLHGATSDNGTWIDLSFYNENMTHPSYRGGSMSEFDIVKVYNIDIYQNAMFTDVKDNHIYDSQIIYAEETITRAEAEQKLGMRIVD